MQSYGKSRVVGLLSKYKYCMQRIIEKLKQEPLVFLSRKVWQFADGFRKDVIFVVIMHIFAQITALVEPLIFASFINEIQKNGIQSSKKMVLLK